MENESKNNVSFYYVINMLKILLNMKYITIEEYKKILEISAEYYKVTFYCV